MYQRQQLKVHNESPLRKTLILTNEVIKEWTLQLQKEPNNKIQTTLNLKLEGTSIKTKVNLHKISLFTEQQFEKKSLITKTPPTLI